MAEQIPGPSVPQFDLADRMRKSLRHAGLGVQDIAAYLGVGRSTVSNWINGRILPSVQTLRLWAMKCGVDYDWLSGGAPPRPVRGGPVTARGFRKPGTLPPSPAVLAVAAL
jgi:transcriptional regulator with XRE-family HTH domain